MLSIQAVLAICFAYGGNKKLSDAFSEFAIEKEDEKYYNDYLIKEPLNNKFLKKVAKEGNYLALNILRNEDLINEEEYYKYLKVGCEKDNLNCIEDYICISRKKGRYCEVIKYCLKQISFGIYINVYYLLESLKDTNLKCPEIIELCSLQIQNDDSNYEPILCLARYLEYKGNYRESLKYYLMILERNLNPEDEQDKHYYCSNIIKICHTNNLKYKRFLNFCLNSPHNEEHTKMYAGIYYYKIEKNYTEAMKILGECLLSGKLNVYFEEKKVLKYLIKVCVDGNLTCNKEIIDQVIKELEQEYKGKQNEYVLRLGAIFWLLIINMF
ncbi:hypothetical protein Catovirus_1_100 [Catovirus CTV1]|uniref:Tetratricopeptide repeat protein n=1 Tax=Catovirus CTV1 TaxID=1977631 RepID=A0A1V0S8L5_9VIRU|nr:hypothetical protein Catovirus_1_100 [Catovirus CTV1]